MNRLYGPYSYIASPLIPGMFEVYDGNRHQVCVCTTAYFAYQVITAMTEAWHRQEDAIRAAEGAD